MSAANPFRDYLRAIREKLQVQGAGEHAHRAALQNYLEAAYPHLLATNEPRRIACGAPDFVITTKDTQVPIGYIEVKDVGADLSAREYREQFKRYTQALNNVIISNYLEFRWFVEGEERGEPVRVARLSGEKIVAEKDAAAMLAQLFDNFTSQPGIVVGTASELARRMAHLTHMLKDQIFGAVQNAEEDSELRGQLAAFRDILLPDLDEEQFADMYAQTIAYGLFAARVNVGEREEFSREHAAFDLPKTNPFLRSLFNSIAGPDLDDRLTWIVDDLARLLGNADMANIMEDFGRFTRQEDPVVHFYETFLREYDPQERKIRGVYYTPEPVVSYIVRSVDWLLKEKFGRPDGLADPNVYILDPAAGTGTFLYFVIQHIYDTLQAKGQAGTWNSYVKENLLQRIFGFEILMAPYTICHMKLAMLLQELGYEFDGDERLGVYLTNTLEEAAKKSELLFANYISEEANAAAEIKRDKPIMVVLGNPPYSVSSQNKGEWIESLMDSYKEAVRGERNIQPLSDDYIKFLRFAQWRIEQTRYGIVGMITNNSYLSGLIHRGMREELMKSFSEIYILDLHGSSRIGETTPAGGKDENVFDIEQGVAIGLFAGTPDSTGGTPVVLKAEEGQKATGRTLDSTGERPVVPRGFAPVTEDVIRPRRRLPHWQQGGATYFVTFKLREGQLAETEQKVVLGSCLHWHGTKWHVYAVVVMPNHVHLLVQPLLVSRIGVSPVHSDKAPFGRIGVSPVRGKATPFGRTGVSPVPAEEYYSLSEILHSVKSYTAHALNRLRNVTGPVWMQESFDRIVRDKDEFHEKLRYMISNPVKAELAEDGFDYAFLWLGGDPEDSAGKGSGALGTTGVSPVESGLAPLPTTRGGDVWHADFWGLQEVKYGTLGHTAVDAVHWSKLAPTEPHYFFVPRDISLESEYDQTWSLPDVLQVHIGGITTSRDSFALDFDHDALQQRISDFANRDVPDEKITDSYGIQSTGTWHMPAARAAVSNSAWERDFVQCLYRPFDTRTLFYSDCVVERPRHEVMKHMLAENLALIATRQTHEPFGVLAVRTVATHKCMAAYDRNFLFPLYVYPESDDPSRMEFQEDREANLNPKFVKEFADNLGMEFVPDGQGDLGAGSTEANCTSTGRIGVPPVRRGEGQNPTGETPVVPRPGTFGPEDVFYYAYAIFHCPTYRERYAEFLKIDFPRLPLTSDVELFRDLVGYGHELVRYHLMREPGEPTVGPGEWTGKDACPPGSVSGGVPEPRGKDKTSARDMPEVDWTLITRYPVTGDDEVEKVRYVEPHVEGEEEVPGRVYINKTQYFEGISPELWEFHIGGYQVMQKWLKDRKGRKLSNDDLRHYQRIAVALTATQRLMSEIDERIEEWPIE